MASTKIDKTYWNFLIKLINSFGVRSLISSEISDENLVTRENISEHVKRSPASPSWVSPGDLVMFNYTRPSSESHIVLVTGNEKTNTGIMNSTAIYQGKRSNLLLCGFKLIVGDVETSYNAIKDLYKNREIKYKQIVATKAVLGEENYRTYLTNRNFMFNFNEVEF